MESKATKVKFVGYDDIDNKVCLMIDLETHKVIKAVSVTFGENTIPLLGGVDPKAETESIISVSSPARLMTLKWGKLFRRAQWLKRRRISQMIRAQTTVTQLMTNQSGLGQEGKSKYRHAGVELTQMLLM